MITQQQYYAYNYPHMPIPNHDDSGWRASWCDCVLCDLPYRCLGLCSCKNGDGGRGVYSTYGGVY